MPKDQPSDKPDPKAKRIKEARWNVRLLPFAYAAFVAFGLYVCFFPVRSVPWRDQMLGSLLLGGTLLWIQSVYLEAKHFLKTGEERLSYSHTIGIGLCTVAFVVWAIFDKKRQISEWTWSAYLAFQFLNRVAQHIDAHRAARRTNGESVA